MMQHLVAWTNLRPWRIASGNDFRVATTNHLDFRYRIHYMFSEATDNNDEEANFKMID